MNGIEHQIDKHLKRLKSLNYSPTTLRNSRFVLRRFAAWLSAAGISSPERLRGRHLENWQEGLSARLNGAGKPLKARSVNKEIAVVRGFISHLVREGAVASSLFNRLCLVKEPKMLPGSVLTHAQARKLLDAIPTDTAEGYRNRTMLEMLYSSGIRAAELLGLNLDDVDLGNRTAVVMGKGRKERMVPFGETTAKLLESYLKAVRPHLLRGARERALFLDGAGQRLPYHTLRRIVHACAEASGTEVNVTPHTFRRSCTTELLRSNANMYHVKELLGHESLDTLKHYAKLTITDLKRTHKRCHPREKD